MLKTGLRNLNVLALIAVAVLLVGVSLNTTPAFAAGLPGPAPEVYLMTNDLTVAAPTSTPGDLMDQQLRDDSTELIGSAGDLSLVQNQPFDARGLADDDPSLAFAAGLADSDNFVGNPA